MHKTVRGKQKPLHVGMGKSQNLINPTPKFIHPIQSVYRKKYANKTSSIKCTTNNLGQTKRLPLSKLYTKLSNHHLKTMPRYPPVVTTFIFTIHCKDSLFIFIL